MASYLSIINKLERGMELCAICGRDITGAPDCVHTRKYYAIWIVNDAKEGEPKDLVRVIYHPKSSYSIRIGEELLLDIPYLKSLPIADPDLVSIRRSLRLWSRILKENGSNKTK